MNTERADGLEYCIDKLTHVGILIQWESYPIHSLEHTASEEFSILAAPGVVSTRARICSTREGGRSLTVKLTRALGKGVLGSMFATIDVDAEVGDNTSIFALNARTSSRP